MSKLIQEVWVKPLELDGAVLIFWSEGGFQGVPGGAGRCWELPGRFPAPQMCQKNLIGAESTS